MALLPAPAKAQTGGQQQHNVLTLNAIGIGIDYMVSGSTFVQYNTSLGHGSWSNLTSKGMVSAGLFGKHNLAPWCSVVIAAKAGYEIFHDRYDEPTVANKSTIQYFGLGLSLEGILWQYPILPFTAATGIYPHFSATCSAYKINESYSGAFSYSRWLPADGEAGVMAGCCIKFADRFQATADLYYSIIPNLVALREYSSLYHGSLEVRAAARIDVLTF